MKRVRSCHIPLRLTTSLKPLRRNALLVRTPNTVWCFARFFLFEVVIQEGIWANKSCLFQEHGAKVRQFCKIRCGYAVKVSKFGEIWMIWMCQTTKIRRNEDTVYAMGASRSMEMMQLNWYVGTWRTETRPFNHAEEIWREWWRRMYGTGRTNQTLERL